jgi:sugar O-acyltransferase (sialic acid O-acetyltransferase NeuD family)
MTKDERDLYVVGAGGHGRELHSYFQDLRAAGWSSSLKGYLDDGIPAGRHGSLEVIGSLSALATGQGPFTYITALGSNGLRRNIVSKLTDLYGDRLAAFTLRHPLAYVGTDNAIGEGTCLAPGSIVTSRATIGRHCIVNIKASISHDCRIGDFVNINPGATLCGTVTVGDGAFIGAGAVIRENVSIGAWSVIGAGAVVVRDVPANVTAVGVPVRIMKTNG